MGLTTIRVSEDVRDAIASMKTQGDDYNAVLTRLLEGYEVEINSIDRPRVAISLKYVGYSTNEDKLSENEYDVTFEELRNAEVGTTYEPVGGDYWYFENQKAEVIFTDGEVILVKLTKESVRNNGNMKDIDIVSIVLI